MPRKTLSASFLIHLGISIHFVPFIPQAYFHLCMLNHFFSLRPKECIVVSFISGVLNAQMQSVSQKQEGGIVCTLLYVYMLFHMCSQAVEGVCVFYM